jgi:hypothetical protein
MALTPMKMGARLRGGLRGGDGGVSNGTGGIRGWSWVARGGRRLWKFAQEDLGGILT